SLFFFISSDLVVQAVQMVRGPVSWGQTVDRFSADVVLPLVRARGLPIGLGTGVGLRFGPGSPGSAPHQAADCNATYRALSDASLRFAYVSACRTAHTRTRFSRRMRPTSRAPSFFSTVARWWGDVVSRNRVGSAAAMLSSVARSGRSS